MHSRRHAYGWWTVLLALILFSAGASAQPANSPPVPRVEELPRLIRQLGHPRFRERERAVNRLRLFGTDAFHPLLENIDAEDAEIRARVRILLDELRPAVLREGVTTCDLPYVHDYSQLSDAQKRLRIRTLADLAPEFGGTALLRIASTESNERLAKTAAAGLLRNAVPSDLTIQRHMKAQLSDVAGTRTPLIWIQQYLQSIDQPGASIDAFDHMVSAEQLALKQAPETTEESDVLDPLRRYTIDLRMRASLKSAAAERTLDLFEDASPESEQRLDLIKWLYQARYYDLLLGLADAHLDWFTTHRFEQYLVAAAAKSMSDESRSDALQRAALDAAMSDNDRLEVAGKLRESGLAEWAEREYRAVCERNGSFVESEESILAIFYLVDIYHQQQRHRECYELLEAVCGQLEAKRNSQEDVNRLLGVFNIESNRLRAAYEKALQALHDGDPQEAMAQFRLALPYAQVDNDVICDAYQLDDAKFREEIEQYKRAIIRQRTQSVARYEQALVQRQNLRNQQVIRSQVARECNELAWIMINTGESVEAALRYAQRSVELDPGLAYSLDTLAVCHFKNGNVPLAVQYEHQALRLMPYREDLQRTLKQFESP